MVSLRQPSRPAAEASSGETPPRWLPRPGSAPCSWASWGPSAHRLSWSGCAISSPSSDSGSVGRQGIGCSLATLGTRLEDTASCGRCCEEHFRRFESSHPDQQSQGFSPLERVASLRRCDAVFLQKPPTPAEAWHTIATVGRRDAHAVLGDAPCPRRTALALDDGAPIRCSVCGARAGTTCAHDADL